MLQDEAQAVLTAQPRRSRSYWGISLHRLLRKKLAVVCLTIIVLMYGAGVLAPLVTPYDYNDQNLAETKQRPSFSHPFGTDRLGRDILTRVIYGLRTTVIITLVTLITGSLIIGIAMGLIAGYFGKLIDSAIMRVGEVTSAFPEIFLVLIFISTFKPPLTEWIRGLEGTLPSKVNQSMNRCI